MSVIVPSLQILYTNIGRGHPFYLDGVIDSLIRKASIRLVRKQSDVFEISSTLPRHLWKIARYLYIRGSSGGVSGVVYRLVRTRADYGGSGLMVRLMGRDIRREYLHAPGPLMVAHPTLVGMLKGKPDLLYQHGELVVPPEAVVAGASVVFVPTEEAANVFGQGGYSDTQVVVTGLCIETPLVRQAFESFEARLDRYAGDQPLTGAFFSSGAEPVSHVDKLVNAACSALGKGGRVLLFARRGGTLAQRARRLLLGRDVDHLEIGSSDQIPADLPQAVIILFNNRREENIFTAKLYSLFDYFVAPPHERSNWAVGLGLPMFSLDPCIGPFAPLNRDLLLDRGVARSIATSSDARSFGAGLERLRRDGNLEAMSRAGWGKQPINGFDTIADYLISHFG